MGGSATGRGSRRDLRRYRGPMSAHPFRLLLLVLAAVGVVAAVRKATADTGGTYDPDAVA